MKVRVKVLSFVNNTLVEPGAIIDVDKLDGRFEPIEPVDKKVDGKKTNGRKAEGKGSDADFLD
jgi:hypothetical protein